MCGELTQLLGACLLLSVLRAVGAICNIYYICLTLDNQMNVSIVLFGSTVLFAAVVAYDMFSLHDVIIVFVYM